MEISVVIGSISRIRGLDFGSRKDAVSAVVSHGPLPSGTKFLSALFDEAVYATSCKGGQDQGDLDLIETYTACCLVALDHCQASNSIIHQFIDSFFLPVLSLPHFPSSFYTQASNDLLSLVKSKGSDLGSALLTKCSDSLLSLLDKQILGTDTNKSLLPLHTCCSLIPALVGMEGGSVEVLLPLSLRLLRSNDDSLALASLRNIITPIIAHYKTVNDMTAVNAMKTQLVSCCIEMMKQPGVMRRNALMALVQLPPAFSPPRLVTEALEEPSDQANPLSELENEFWMEIINSLSTKDDSLDRKRANYVLQQILGPVLSSHPWAAWISIFSILEEFAIHLIKPLWRSQIDKLHPPSTMLANRDEPHGKPKIGLNGRVDKIKGKARAADKFDGNPSECPSCRLHMGWQCVIWTRAFSHPNILMRRLSLRTFLNRSWDSPRVVSEVPLSFVTNALMPTLLSEDVHYSPSSADDDYAGGELASLTDITELASSWLSTWLSVKSREDKREVIQCFLSFNIGSRDIPRSCLLPAWLIFSRSLMAAKDLDLSSRDYDDGFVSRSIFSLKSCRTTLSLPSGLDLKKDLSLCLLQSASVIAPMASCSNASGIGPLDLIIDLPCSWISPQGHLNATCRSWLSSGSDEDSSSTRISALIRKVSDKYWEKEEVDDRDAASRLAYLLSIFAQDPAPAISSAMSASVTRAMEAVASLHRRTYLSDSLIDRALLLHLSLVKAASCSPPSSTFHQCLSTALSRIETDLGHNLLHCIESLWSSEAMTDSEVEKLDKSTARLKLMVQSSCLTLKMIRSPGLSHALTYLLSKTATESPGLQRSPLLSAADVTHLTVSIFDSAAQASSPSRLKDSEPSVCIKINTLLVTVLNTCKSLESRLEMEMEGSSGSSWLKMTNRMAPNDTRNSKAALSGSKWTLLDSILSWPLNELSSDLCRQIVLEGLDALQSCSESTLISILRSIRACLSLALSGSCSDRRLLLVALQGSSEDLDDDLTVLVQLLWSILRPICSSMLGCTRKKVPLIICYLSVVLMPQIFTFRGLRIDKKREKEALASIHGQGGPVYFVIGRLLEWGKTSPRVMLLISSHLAALIELSPRTLGHISPHIKTLLLSSSNHRGEGGDLDLSQDATEAETQEVKSSLIPDPAPHGSIMAAHLGTDVAPRAAIAYGLHNVATSCRGKSSARSLVVAPDEAGSKIKESIKRSKEKRPVIIFHQEGTGLADWDEGGEGEEGAKEYETVIEASTASNSEDEIVDAEVVASGLEIFKDLVRTALDDPVLSNDNVKQGSELHRRKVRLWQAIGITSAFLPVTPSSLEETRAVAEAMMSKCFSPVSPPSVKQYAEGVLAGMLLRHPSLIDDLLLPSIEKYELNHSGVGSLILIAGQVLMHVEDKTLQQTLIPRLMLAIAPWLMSHSHSTRSVSQMIAWAVLQRYPLDSDLWQHSLGDITYLKSIIRFMDVNPDLVRLRKGIGEESILPWRPTDLSHPSRLYTNNISLAGTGSRHAVSNSGKEWSSFEGCTQSVIDVIGAYLVLERHRLRDNIWEREREREEGYEVQGSSTLGLPSAAVDFQRKISPQDIGVHYDNTASLINSGLEDLLVKARASLRRQGRNIEEEEEDDDDDDDKADGLLAPLPHPARPLGEVSSDQEIIICATLVDKIPNLAGLARTCEVFQASCLCIPNLSAAQDPLFSSISVTAEKWIPIAQVTEVQLMPYLHKKQKMEGYSILGLEQSSESTMLPSFKFPKKCVLVLGREKEGLPAEIMSMLDHTIEIPQLGLIRSLNVHVSASIALYEYRSQYPGRR